MKIIKRYKINLWVIVYTALMLFFSCKTKYEKVTYIDSHAEIYLNGAYLNKELSKNGYFFQHIYTKFMTFGEHTLEEPIPWGYRIGKYKYDKQEGNWITYTFWESEKVLEEPQVRRKERFKNGLQNGSYMMVRGM